MARGRPVITDIVQAVPDVAPFVGPEAQERTTGITFRARLGANECVFGPSPKSIAAMTAAVAENWKYSDPENHDLRHAIAAFHGVGPCNVVIGEGIDGLLGLTVRMCAEPGTSIVTSDGAYPTFNFHVATQGARLVKVPFKSDREDLGALLDAAIVANARVLYVSNPNNPMGTWSAASEINRLIESLPDGLLLILDEAYCDTAPADAIPAIDVSNPQVLHLRTFSKAYGLAGARVGYAIGDVSVIRVFEKVRNHYGINRIGQIGALAALADQDYLAATVERISASRERISQIARVNGLAPIASAANFVTIDCMLNAAFATRVLAELLAGGVFVRKPAVSPLDRCIRVSTGRDEDMAVLAEALPPALAAARS